MTGVPGRRNAALLAAGATLALACGAPPPDFGGPVAGWPTVGGDRGGSRFSPNDQIDTDNVANLEEAWRRGRAGRPPGSG